MLFGEDVDFALCAYRPRCERIPKQASSQQLYMCVAQLSPDGTPNLSPWSCRPASARRAPFDRQGACIFAFRYVRPVTGSDTQKSVAAGSEQLSGSQCDVQEPGSPVSADACRNPEALVPDVSESAEANPDLEAPPVP